MWGATGVGLLYLDQWFLTVVEVLNPASFTGAFTEPFEIGKILYDFFKTQVYILLVHKMNHASVAHKNIELEHLLNAIFVDLVLPVMKLCCE